MNRKEFLQTSLMGAAAVAASTTGASLLTSCAPKNDTPLRISFQEGTAPGKTLEEKFDYMENLGIVGYEPGGWNLAARVNEFQQALKGRNIKISAICAGFQGFLLAEDPAVKAQFDSTMRDIIAAAGEIWLNRCYYGACVQPPEALLASHIGDSRVPLRADARVG